MNIPAHAIETEGFALTGSKLNVWTLTARNLFAIGVNRMSQFKEISEQIYLGREGNYSTCGKVPYHLQLQHFPQAVDKPIADIDENEMDAPLMQCSSTVESRGMLVQGYIR